MSGLLGTGEETKGDGPKKKVQVGTGGQVLGRKDQGLMVSVKPILEAFKSNTKEGRDVKKQFARMGDLENHDEYNIVTALDQLTDILCQAAYFQKAYDILKTALGEYEHNCYLNEIMARVCFIMEQFDQCIYYNKQAKKLADENDSVHHSNLNSDIGLAQYRLAIQGNDRFRELAFKSCRKALELYPDNTSAMVNLGLIYKLGELIDPGSKGESEAAKLFKAAVDKDRANYPNDISRRNPAALVNLGVIEYEFNRYEDAAILFLDALVIKPDD